MIGKQSGVYYYRMEDVGYYISLGPASRVNANNFVVTISSNGGDIP